MRDSSNSQWINKGMEGGVKSPPHFVQFTPGYCLGPQNVPQNTKKFSRGACVQTLLEGHKQHGLACLHPSLPLW